MVTNVDFSWSEVGAHIRDKRKARGLTQQQLADAAGLTQNGIYRLEFGMTNPQIETLMNVAQALGCSVRELVTGPNSPDDVSDDRLRRVRRIVAAGDPVALRTLDGGIDAAEALLDRSSRQPAMPPRKLVLKGEGRRDNDLLWGSAARLRTSSTETQATLTPVQKPGQTLRNISKHHGTSSSNRER